MRKILLISFLNILVFASYSYSDALLCDRYWPSGYTQYTPYSIDCPGPAQASFPSGNAYTDELDLAVYEWNNIPDSSFHFDKLPQEYLEEPCVDILDTQDGINTIAWVVPEDCVWVGVTRRAFAGAGQSQLIGYDMQFNRGDNCGYLHSWVPRYMDDSETNITWDVSFRSVALHEFGHALGLPEGYLTVGVMGTGTAEGTTRLERLMAPERGGAFLQYGGNPSDDLTITSIYLKHWGSELGYALHYAEMEHQVWDEYDIFWGDITIQNISSSTKNVDVVAFADNGSLDIELARTNVTVGPWGDPVVNLEEADILARLIPPDQEGYFNLNICVDPDNLISESNENNNCIRYWREDGKLWIGTSSNRNISVPNDYTKIQTAIDNAFAGDIITVSPGHYYESLDFKGKAITLTSTHGPESTILHRSVVFNSGEGNESVIEGFTIRDAHTGVEINFSDPIIRNNIITDNSLRGIYCNKCKAIISGNEITENGYYNDYFNEEIGGGIHMKNYARPEIENNLIAKNKSYLGGAGVSIYDAVPSFKNNTIVNNKCYSLGCGIYVHDVPEVYGENRVIRIYNGILYDNSYPHLQGTGLNNFDWELPC